MSLYFPEPYERSGGNVNAELDLSNYGTQTDLKTTIGINTSTMASKTDFPILKTKVENLDGDKLKHFPTSLIKLSNIVDNNVIKKLCIITCLLKSILLI